MEIKILIPRPKIQIPAQRSLILQKITKERSKQSRLIRHLENKTIINNNNPTITRNINKKIINKFIKNRNINKIKIIIIISI